jgi:hypothetical protein
VIRSGESGIALLEAIVALTILGTAGLGMVAVVDAGLRGERDARQRERTLAAEQRVLAAATLLKRGELDQRLGRHTVGDLIVDLQRPERTLYRIAVLQARSPAVEDLVTVVYRREDRDAH